MALVTLKWPSASGRVDRASSGAYCGGTHTSGDVMEAGIPRRRTLSSTNGRRQETPRDVIASRCRTAKNISVSRSKSNFQPKPPPPQGRRRAEHNMSFQQGSKSTHVNTGLATTQPRKSQPVPAPKPASSNNTVKAENISISVPNIVRESTATVGLRLLSTDGCSAGAPSSSAIIALNIPLSTNCLSSCRPTDEKSPLIGERVKSGCSTSETAGSLANTTRSCWDERGGSVDTPADAASPPLPRYGSASSTGNKAATCRVPEAHQNEPLPQQPGPSNSLTRSRGLKGLRPGSALPLLSPEQEILSNGIKMCRERLVPLRRRKSDVVGGGVRARASSNSSGSTGAPTSAGSESSLSKRRSSTSALRSSDMSRPSTTNSVNTARERGSSGRISRSSESGTGLAADQGHLKARLRVMEWKRRRAEEIKTQQEEQATLEQLQQAEAETEAARKLAAARAEEAERRIAAGRESTAEAVRATESAEKWAKTSRQRERRRAEVYAINAVMRTSFEREFEAYSLEQETLTARAAAPASPAQALTGKEASPQQQ